MAKHERDNHFFRNLPSRVFWPLELPEDFRSFYDAQVRSLIKFKGYKLDQKHEVARHIVQNLILAAFPEMGVVSDPRDTGSKAASRVPVWDAVVAAGLAEVCVGAENKRMVTRYRASNKLLDLQEKWELKLVTELKLARNTEGTPPSMMALVVLHSGTVDPMTGEPLPDDEQRKPLGVPNYPYWLAVENLIERINRSNTAHAWQAFAVDRETGKEHVWQPNVTLRQIHCGQFFRGARLYCPTEWSGQSIPKEDRRRLLIDGEAVCELDFSCMAIRMLYHQNQMAPEGDLYRPEQVFPNWYSFPNVRLERRAVVRDFIKRVTNIALNVKTRKRAVGAVTNILCGDEEPLLRRVLTADALTLGSLLDRITDAVHGDLQGEFYEEKGLELMTTDGKIMLGILKEFADAGKPCLPIHDACVVKLSDRAYAHRIMRETYRTYIGHDPVIKRAF